MKWTVDDDALRDDGSIDIDLLSPDEVRSPTRSVSALSRLLVSRGSLLNYGTVNGSAFKSEVIAYASDGNGILSAPEALKLIVEILFERNGIEGRQRSAADAAARKIEGILEDYVDAKSRLS